jgi:hypothetical protein
MKLTSLSAGDGDGCWGPDRRSSDGTDSRARNRPPAFADTEVVVRVMTDLVGGRFAGPVPASGIARNAGLLALSHWTSVDNIIDMLADGWLRPAASFPDGQPRGIGCGSPDFGYFGATGPISPDPKRYTTNRTDACMFFDCGLLDREDWFWNPKLLGGHRGPNAVAPGDDAGIERLARASATRTGDWAGEICFRRPVQVQRCFRIFVADEELRQQILEATRNVRPPAGMTWEQVIRPRAPRDHTLGATDLPRWG